MDVVRMKFGSHVYGTNVPTSDLDFKAIYLPSRRDILLQRVRPNITSNTKSDPTAKNTAQDVDSETFSLQQYLHLLMEGQTVALDMLFTPESFFLPLSDGDFSHDAWRAIRAHKDRFLHSGVTAFAGYARTQAAKYGIKGSRINAVRRALEAFKSFPQKEKLYEHDMEVRAFANSATAQDLLLNKEPLIRMVDILHKGRGVLEPHIEICNRKYALHCTFEYIVERLQKIFDEYGHRARLAEQHEGIDWKALMHAVRVNHEAVELLSTGNITFPRPEAPLLLKIRQGELPYKEVAEIIETGLLEMEEWSKKSVLRKEPDREFADELVEIFHSEAIGEY